MSDRMITSFLRDLKRKNDGLIPKDQEVSIFANDTMFNGVLKGCDDAAGVVTLETVLSLKGKKDQTVTTMVRYDRIAAITIIT